MLLADRRNILGIWRKILGDVEKHVVKYIGNLEKTCSVIWRNSFGDLEKTCSAIWRNVVGVVMAISYWTSLWSSTELGDRMWRLNRNGEIMETNYGDQNFIHHKIDSTYLGCFKDRNI